MHERRRQDELARLVNVAPLALDLDRRETISEGSRTVELGCNHEFAGVIRIAPFAIRPHSSQTARKVLGLLIPRTYRPFTTYGNVTRQASTSKADLRRYSQALMKVSAETASVRWKRDLSTLTIYEAGDAFVP